jgi:hypothetical protein
VVEDANSILIDRRLLEPELKPAPGRDPFAEVGAARETRVAAANAGTAAASRTAAGRPSDRAQPATGSAAAAAPIWTLGGTVIQGKRRAAIVNGRVYSLGDEVKAVEPGGPTARVIQIERDLVLLRVENRPRPLALTYAGAPRPGAKPEAPAAAVPDLAGLSKRLMEGRVEPLLRILGVLGGGGVRP